MRYRDLLLGGRMFTASQRLTSTALLNGNWVLFNPIGHNRVLYLYQLDLTVTAAIEIDLFAIHADPGLTIGNTPTNSNIGNLPAQATFEAQAVAKPTGDSTIASIEATAGGPVATLLDQPLRIPAGFGVLLSTALTAATVAAVFGWAEVGPDSDLAGE